MATTNQIQSLLSKKSEQLEGLKANIEVMYSKIGTIKRTPWFCFHPRVKISPELARLGRDYEVGEVRKQLERLYDVCTKNRLNFRDKVQLLQEAMKEAALNGDSLREQILKDEYEEIRQNLIVEEEGYTQEAKVLTERYEQLLLLQERMHEVSPDKKLCTETKAQVIEADLRIKRQMQSSAVKMAKELNDLQVMLKCKELDELLPKSDSSVIGLLGGALAIPVNMNSRIIKKMKDGKVELKEPTTIIRSSSKPFLVSGSTEEGQRGK